MFTSNTCPCPPIGPPSFPAEYRRCRRTSCRKTAPNVSKKLELGVQELELGSNSARPSMIFDRQMGRPGNSLLNRSTMSYLPAVSPVAIWQPTASAPQFTGGNAGPTKGPANLYKADGSGSSFSMPPSLERRPADWSITFSTAHTAGLACSGRMTTFSPSSERSIRCWANGPWPDPRAGPNHLTAAAKTARPIFAHSDLIW